MIRCPCCKFEYNLFCCRGRQATCCLGNWFTKKTVHLLTGLFNNCVLISLCVGTTCVSV